MRISLIKTNVATRLSTYGFYKVIFFILQKLPYYRYFGKFCLRTKYNGSVFLIKYFLENRFLPNILMKQLFTLLDTFIYQCVTL
jgi:hypothetical protein